MNWNEQLEESQDTQNNFSHLGKPFIEVVEQHQHNFQIPKKQSRRQSQHELPFKKNKMSRLKEAGSIFTFVVLSFLSANIICLVQWLNNPL